MMSNEKKWDPGFADLAIERQMEERDICEADRDEVRKFADVLRRIKDKKAGVDVGPPPEGMIEWLKGEDDDG